MEEDVEKGDVWEVVEEKNVWEVVGKKAEKSRAVVGPFSVLAMRQELNPDAKFCSRATVHS